MRYQGLSAGSARSGGSAADQPGRRTVRGGTGPEMGSGIVPYRMCVSLMLCGTVGTNGTTGTTGTFGTTEWLEQLK